MAKYHINNDGNPGLCKARVECPFGDDLSHYESEQLARAAYEEAQEVRGWWRPTRASILEKLDLKAKRERDDLFEVTLEEDGRVLSTLLFRVLPGKIIWPQWRENNSVPGLPHPPKGVHDELQRRVLNLLPGWAMASNQHELSPEGKAFRESFMARNPEVKWALDPSLESDEGVREATPPPSKKETREMLEGTPLLANSRDS